MLIRPMSSIAALVAALNLMSCAPGRNGRGADHCGDGPITQGIRYHMSPCTASPCQDKAAAVCSGSDGTSPAGRCVQQNTQCKVTCY
jgi:hypothetical protein